MSENQKNCLTSFERNSIPKLDFDNLSGYEEFDGLDSSCLQVKHLSINQSC